MFGIGGVAATTQSVSFGQSPYEDFQNGQEFLPDIFELFPNLDDYLLNLSLERIRNNVRWFFTPQLNP